MNVRERREGVSDHLSEQSALQRLSRTFEVQESSNTNINSNHTKLNEQDREESNIRCNVPKRNSIFTNLHYSNNNSSSGKLMFYIRPQSRSDYYLPRTKLRNESSGNKENEFADKYETCKACCNQYNNTYNSVNSNSIEENGVTECAENSPHHVEFVQTQKYNSPDDAYVAFQCELLRHCLFTQFINSIFLPTLTSSESLSSSSSSSSSLILKTSSANQKKRERCLKKFAEHDLNVHGECATVTKELTPNFTWAELQELPARWVIQSINEMQEVKETRTHVTPLDVNEVVLLGQTQNSNRLLEQRITCEEVNDKLVFFKNNNNNINCNDLNKMYYRVTNTASMSNGEYWVEVEPIERVDIRSNCNAEGIESETKSDMTLVTMVNNHNQNSCLRVEREEVELVQPKPLYIDPFIPCDEAFAIQGTSTCIYVSLLKALQRCEQSRQTQRKLSKSLQKNKSMESCQGKKFCAEYRKNCEVSRKRKDELNRSFWCVTNNNNNNNNNEESNKTFLEQSREDDKKMLLLNAKRQASCIAIDIALSTRMLRQEFALQQSSLCKKLWIETPTTMSSTKKPLWLYVEWNALNNAVLFRLPICQYVLDQWHELLERLPCTCNTIKEQVESNILNKQCKCHSCYKFTVRSETVLQLACRFNVYMSNEHDKNIITSRSEHDITVHSTNSDVDPVDHFTCLQESCTGSNNVKLQGEYAQINSSIVNTENNNECTSVYELCEMLHANSLRDMKPSIYKAYYEQPYQSNTNNKGHTCDLDYKDHNMHKSKVNAESDNSDGTQKNSTSASHINANDNSTPTTNEDDKAKCSTVTQLICDTSCNVIHSLFNLFVLRVSTMCLRYRTLFGERGYNQGPHAALPRYVMEKLHYEFDITAEGFASPLNASLPQYTSLFPDTDVYFGSCGSFFDVIFTSGHVEVNPPFDTSVMRKMEEHLIYCLEQSETHTNKQNAEDNKNSISHNLLFVVILPSHSHAERNVATFSKRNRISHENHDNDYSNNLSCDRVRTTCQNKSESSSDTKLCLDKTSTEFRLMHSRYCLGHILCNAEESCYVDGHQHLLHEGLFCITTPTRFIVLGNNRASKEYSNKHDEVCVNVHHNDKNDDNAISKYNNGNVIDHKLWNVRSAWAAFTHAAKLSPNVEVK